MISHDGTGTCDVRWRSIPNHPRSEEQTDTKALVPVTVVRPPPVAIRRAAVPGRVVPAAAAYDPVRVPACPRGI